MGPRFYAHGESSKRNISGTHLSCGELVAEPPLAPVANAEIPGSCARDVVVEVELGLEIGSSVAGSGKVGSSLMTILIEGSTGDKARVGVGQTIGARLFGRMDANMDAVFAI